MRPTSSEVSRARSVGLDAVHAYLSTNGWLRADSLRRETAEVYLWSADSREAAIVPASEGYADYGTRIYQIAEQIGRVEGRPRYEVLSDLCRERSNEEIQGYVSQLARGEEDPTGTASIKTFVDGKLVSVRVNFGSADYSEMTRAHEARLSVSLEGDLYRDGQRWHLRNPRRVTVMEDEDG